MDTLQELFRYHGWATVKVLTSCSALSPEQLRTPVPGTFGPILPTLVHLVVADQGYLRHITGVLPDPPLEAGSEPSLAELRSRTEAQTERWLALLDRREEIDFTLKLPQVEHWPDVPHAQHLILSQAIHHGNEHRAQVCSALGALGREVPEIGVWEYWEAVHLR